MLNKSLSLSIVMVIALAFCVSAQPKIKEVAYFYDEDQKLYGFNDPVTGAVVVSPKYEQIDGTFADGLMLVVTKSKYGYIDNTGKEIISLKYDAAGQFAEGLAPVKKQSGWFYIDQKENKVIDASKYAAVGVFSDGLAQVQQNDQWGFIDRSGTVVIPIKYKASGSFIKGKALVALAGTASGDAKVSGIEKVGIIDKTGKELFVLPGQDIRNFSEGLAALKSDNKWGFVDTLGKVVIPFKFSDCGDYYRNVAVARLNDKSGLIDKSGKEVNSFKYDFLSRITSKLLLAFNGSLQEDGSPGPGKYGIMDYTGKFVLPQQYDEIKVYVGLIGLVQNNKIGFADTTGKIIAPVQNDELPTFKEGVAAVKSNGKWGYISIDGKLIAPFIYDNVHDFVDGVGRIYKDDKLGFIDTKGKILSQCVLDSYFEGPFDGKYMVSKLGKFGLLDKTGLIVPCIYTSIFTNKKGYSEAILAKKTGVIDPKGKIIVPTIYDGVNLRFDEKAILVNNNGKYGITDMTGKIIIPVKYDKIKKWDDNRYMIELGGKSGFVTKNGVEIAPLIFEYIGPERSIASTGETRICVKSNGKYGFLDYNLKIAIPCVYDFALDFANGKSLVSGDDNSWYIDKDANVVKR